MFWRKGRKPEPELKRRRIRFTAEELGKIREMLEKGMEVKEIAKELGRTEKSIYNIIYKQRLRTSLKESLAKLSEREEELRRGVEARAQTIEELQKKLNALNEEIIEKENRLNALNREIEAKKGELRTIEYLRAKGFEEVRRFMDAHAWEIFTLKLNEVLKSLGILR